MKRTINFIILLAHNILSIIIFLPLSNSKADSNLDINIKIKNEKETLQKKIKEIELILSKVNKRKATSLGQLNAIQIQIESNKRLINLTNKQINTCNRDLKLKKRKINSLEKKLRNLKEDYSKMIYEGVKTMNMINVILFIFSSKSFNEMFQKIQYINQYTKSRRKYFKKIKETTNNLKIQKNIVQKKKQKVKELLIENTKEKKRLDTIKKIQIETIGVLNKKSKNLKKDLKQQNKAMQQIEKLLDDTIKDDKDIESEELYDLGPIEEPEEIIKKKPEVYKKPPSKIRRSPKPKSKITQKPRPRNLNYIFYKNRGKLPWPVKEGFISNKFGTRPHPVLKKVKVQNHGIDIQTKKDSQALAIFGGIVKVVAYVPGMQQVVIIKHGPYHTVYARLKSPKVKVGDKVKALDPIGIIYTNSIDGITELQFQIRKGASATTLNPVNWLLKK